MARATVVPPPTSPYDQAIAGFAPLDDNDIAAQTDSGSFSRGRTYFRGNRIFHAVRRENTLSARCRGSSGGPYRVEATLATADKPGRHNPVSYFCNCPRGGFCKHVVALLLTWVDNPASFEVRPPIAETLASKSKEELIALIELMLHDQPNLEKLLDRPVVAAIPLSDAPVDETAIRRQIAATIDDELNPDYDDDERYDRYGSDGQYGGFGGDDYQQGHRIAVKLGSLAQLMEAYADAGHWRNSFVVAATFAEALAPRLAEIGDEGDELDTLVVRADAELAACLDIQPQLPDEQRLSSEERTRLIDAILTIWEADVDFGGIDLSVAGPEAVARGASPDEQQRVADHVREMMSAPSSSGDPMWRRRAAIGFLSLLKGDAGLSDEELLAEYRNAELWDDAATLLLERGRFDEAIVLGRRYLIATPQFIAFADCLIGSGDRQRTEQAIALVDDRLWEHEGENIQNDQALRTWLERRYLEHGHPEKALALAHDRFKQAPSKATYDAVKTAARQPGQPSAPWTTLRKDLLAVLRQKDEWCALIDIFLEDGEIGEALDALQKSQKAKRAVWSYGWGISPTDYIARVAAAAEADFPDESLRLYRQLADRRIDERNRSSYQYAAGYLANIWRVLESHNRAQEWPPLIGEVRARNKTLRALREELDALGLRE